MTDNQKVVVEGIKQAINNGGVKAKVSVDFFDDNGKADGYKYWYRNGELHREDGPAIEYANGYKYWYLNGIEYTESSYKAEIAKRSNSNPCNGKVVEIDGKKYQLIAI